MPNKVTLSTITSLIKSMETKRKSAVDFAVRIDSKGFTKSDGKQYFYCGKPNKPDGSLNTVSTLFYGFCAFNSTNNVKNRIEDHHERSNGNSDFLCKYHRENVDSVNSAPESNGKAASDS